MTTKSFEVCSKAFWQECLPFFEKKIFFTSFVKHGLFRMTLIKKIQLYAILQFNQPSLPVIERSFDKNNLLFPIKSWSRCLITDFSIKIHVFPEIPRTNCKAQRKTELKLCFQSKNCKYWITWLELKSLACFTQNNVKNFFFITKQKTLKGSMITWHKTQTKPNEMDSKSLEDHSKLN